MSQRTSRSAASRVVLPLVVGVLIALAAAPGEARADELGQQSVLVISAEKLFGFAFGEQEYEFGRNDVDQDFAIFGLGLTADQTPLWTPRVAIDGYVIDGLSLGGSLGFAFIDNDEDGDDATLFLIAFRVGYTYMFTDWVGIWPRGGFTYYNVGEDDDDGFDNDWEQDQFAIDLECMFPFVLTEGFGIEVGPEAHIGLVGEHGFNDNDNDYQEWGIGITVGLLGWLGV